MQLERILHRHGFGTRKGCRALVRQGRVSIGGDVCDDPSAELATEGLVFAVDGVDWPCVEFATVLLHKPAGYECSRKPQHHPSVLELLPSPLRERGVQPIGRLDDDCPACGKSTGQRPPFYIYVIGGLLVLLLFLALGDPAALLQFFVNLGQSIHR